MSLPTKMNVQVLGNGTVLLFTVSSEPTMNVNFAMSDVEFLRGLHEIVERCQDHPNSLLGKIMFHMDEVGREPPQSPA